MDNLTDDRAIRDSMKTNPKWHADKAREFIGRQREKLKKSGVTSSERSQIYKSMKWFDTKRKKFESGKGLDPNPPQIEPIRV